MSKPKQRLMSIFFLENLYKVAKNHKKSKIILTEKTMEERHLTNDDIIEFAALHRISCRPEHAYLRDNTRVGWIITL